MIDDEYLDGRAFGFQLEAELLLQRRKYRRTVRIDGRQRHTRRQRALRHSVWREREIDIEISFEPGAIENMPLCHLREHLRQLCEGYSARQYLIGSQAYAAERPLSRWWSRRWRSGTSVTATATAHGRAIGRRRPETGAELPVASRNHQRVNGHLTRFAMRPKLEPIFEQILEHEIQRPGRTSRRSTLNFAFGLRHDVEACRLDPVRRPEQLRALQAICLTNDLPQRSRRRETAAGLDSEHHA